MEIYGVGRDRGNVDPNLENVVPSHHQLTYICKDTGGTEDQQTTVQESTRCGAAVNAEDEKLQ